jgi:hypothetical protein
VKVDRLRLAGTANGKVNGIAGSGVGPIVFEGSMEVRWMPLTPMISSPGSRPA